MGGQVANQNIFHVASTRDPSRLKVPYILVGLQISLRYTVSSASCPQWHRCFAVRLATPLRHHCPGFTARQWLRHLTVDSPSVPTVPLSARGNCTTVALPSTAQHDRSCSRPLRSLLSGCTPFSATAVARSVSTTATSPTVRYHFGASGLASSPRFLAIVQPLNSRSPWWPSAQ